MEKGDKIFCGVCIGIIMGFLLFLFIAMLKGESFKKSKEVVQTYEVTYVNGLKEIVSYKVHEGAKACIISEKGSYYLLFYENVNSFGFKYKLSDGCVPGVVSYKRVK